MSNRLQAFFEKTVNRVENNSTPFSRYLLLFAAILSVRLALEFMSSRRLYSADDILHIGLWFLFIVLAFIIQMKVFSGEQMQKVAKLVIVFFTIALTAPILDLVITWGVGARMNYLSISNWKDLWWSYITIGGSGFSRGATPGIRLEIVLLLLAIFNYVRTKRQSSRWALFAVFCMYNILFLSGAIPLILSSIVKTFHLNYQHDDRSTILLLLCFDVPLLLIAQFFHRPAFLSRIIKAIPWGAAQLCVIFFILGACLSLHNYPGNFELTTTTLFWFPLLFLIAVCLVTYAALQRIHNRDPEKNTSYTAVKNLLLLTILFTSAVMSAKIFFSLAVFWALLFLLYEAPLFLVKVPVLRNLLEALVFLAAALAGFSAFNAPMIGFPYQWLWLILLSVFAGSLFTDLIAQGGNIYNLFSPQPRQGQENPYSKYFKITASMLFMLVFVIIGYLRFENKLTCVFFLLCSLLPVFVLWRKPKHTQLILFCCCPSAILLLTTI